MLSARCAFDAYIKHENHTAIGAFKVRGGVNLFANLPEKQRARGVITATRGNHGLSIAYAARMFGARCVIYVPKGNNPDKNAGMLAMGAELIETSRAWKPKRGRRTKAFAMFTLRTNLCSSQAWARMRWRSQKISQMPML